MENKEVLKQNNKQKYTIEACNDNKSWRIQARFEIGQESRWGTPFNPEVALREAQGFATARYKDYKYVRVIIEI